MLAFCRSCNSADQSDSGLLFNSYDLRDSMAVMLYTINVKVLICLQYGFIPLDAAKY